MRNPNTTSDGYNSVLWLFVPASLLDQFSLHKYSTCSEDIILLVTRQRCHYTLPLRIIVHPVDQLIVREICYGINTIGYQQE